MIAGQQEGQLANLLHGEPVHGSDFRRIGMQLGGWVEVRQPPAQVNSPGGDTMPNGPAGNDVHVQFLAQFAAECRFRRFARFECSTRKTVGAGRFHVGRALDHQQSIAA